MLPQHYKYHMEYQTQVIHRRSIRSQQSADCRPESSTYGLVLLRSRMPQYSVPHRNMEMPLILSCFFPPVFPLFHQMYCKHDAVSRHCKCHNGRNNADKNQLNCRTFQFIEIIDDAYSRRYKKECHITQQKICFLLYMLDL